MIKLPDLKFELKKWRDSDFVPMDLAAESLRKLAGTAGQCSDLFKEWCRRLMRYAENDDVEGLVNNLEKPVSFRALAHLWRSEDEFLVRCRLNEVVLNQLDSSAEKISRQGVLMFAGAFFERFEQLGSESSLGQFGIILEKVLQRFESGSSEIAVLQRHAKDIFSPNGPQWVVEQAMQDQLDLDLALNRFGLKEYSNSRFVTICRYRYYIEKLKTIPLKDHKDPVLSEVVKPEVFSSPGNQGEFIGHEILRTVITRVRDSNEEVPDHWRDIVMTIAGDPRVPKSSKKYQTWWQILGDDYVQPVVGWLSQFDLKLFLEIIEDYGQRTHNSDLNRMFPGRKSFLEGLLANGVVKETRLFLCADAERYLKRQYVGDKLPSYAKVHGNYDQTLIYLKVGSLHMIEGSHNCKLWIYPRLPEIARVTNYSVKEFTYRAMTQNLKSEYMKEFDMPFESITHSSSEKFLWENKAISYMQDQGLDLDIRKLFSREDYKRYRNYYEV